MQPTFSTLCTSFNRPDMLKNCVESVRANTYENWQLIIGDSTKDKENREKIADYCNTLAKEDERIVFKQFRAWSDEEDNRKCNYAWKNNQMFKISDGKYITYHNDDDLYSKDYYQSFLDAFAKYPEASVAYCGQKAYVLNDTGIYS
jgi:O-antigen biosynthesis protein